MRDINAPSILKKLKYQRIPPLIHSCGNCKYSEVTNPGANIPGLRCFLMAKLLFKKGLIKSIEFTWSSNISYNCQVDDLYGTCNEWKPKSKLQ